MAEVDNEFVLVDAVEARIGSEQLGLPFRTYYKRSGLASTLTEDMQSHQKFERRFKSGWLPRNFLLNQVTSISTCDLMFQRQVNGLESPRNSFNGRTGAAQHCGSTEPLVRGRALLVPP